MTMKQLETLTKVQHFTQCGYKKVLKPIDKLKNRCYNKSVKRIGDINEKRNNENKKLKTKRQMDT